MDKHVIFIGGAVVLIVIAAALLLSFHPWSTMTSTTYYSTQPSGLESQTQGVIKGTETTNLPGSAAGLQQTNTVTHTGGTVVMPAPQPQPTGVACTQDAMLCPDGSYVSRMPPNCQFAACPGR